MCIARRLKGIEDVGCRMEQAAGVLDGWSGWVGGDSADTGFVVY